jgi:hypothetical protein
MCHSFTGVSVGARRPFRRIHLCRQYVLDLVNSLGVIPQDHKYFKEEIAVGRPATRYQGYVETDSKLIQKALFESDYTLSAKLKEQIQFGNPPPPSNPSPTVLLRTENQNEQKALLPEDQFSKQEPKKIRTPGACTLKTDTPLLTPKKTPARIAKPSTSSLKRPIETPKSKTIGGIGLLTPETTPGSNSPIYISSDDDEDITIMRETRVMRLQDSPLRFRRGYK